MLRYSTLGRPTVRLATILTLPAAAGLLLAGPAATPASADTALTYAVRSSCLSS